MISVVCFKWHVPGYRSNFTAENVNISRRMVSRFYQAPHRFICVTDDPAGLDEDIEVIPLWDDFSDIQNPTWPKGPSCYRRLKLFAQDAAALFGERIVQIDLDMVFTGDLSPLWKRKEDFVIWGTGNPRIPYCASMFLLRAGALSRIWTDFDPVASPRLTQAGGFRGSDQAWINYCLGQDIPTWRQPDGVYSYRDHLVSPATGALRRRVRKPAPPVNVPLPGNARAIVFHGKPDPWDADAMSQSPWILDFYR